MLRRLALPFLASVSFVRLRASVFVNLVLMRECLNRHHNTGIVLTKETLKVLQTANYLFHAAHNRCSEFHRVFAVSAC